MIGVYPFVGASEFFCLLDVLRARLNSKGLHYLSHAQDPSTVDPYYWKNTEVLGLVGPLVEEWYSFMDGLKHVGISLLDVVDSLFWEGNKSSGQISV